MNRLLYRKSQRLASKEDFTRVLSHKCFVCRGMLRLYAAPNGLDIPRFGVSVSQSCGGAVVRNRLKRYGREVFRLHQHEIVAGFDYILIFTRKKPKIKTTNEHSKKMEQVQFQYKDIEGAFLTMIRALTEKMT